MTPTLAPPVLPCCPHAPHYCPTCGLIMSHREWDEQRQCNECGIDAWARR